MARTRVDDVVTTGLDDIDQTAETKTDFRRTITTAEQDIPGTKYTPNWSKWFGYYKTVPELQAVIDKKAIWTVGKGYKADKKTQETLNRIRGCGIDTFDSITDNWVKTYTIGGDSFSEIIKNKRGELRNLKPLNPGSMSVLSSSRGIIENYEQLVLPKTKGEAGKIIKFKPDQIFHLAWNRLGDECHGRSTIEKLQEIIDMKNEAQQDIRIVFHRYVKPLLITQVDSDDETVISKLKAKLDNAVKNMENIIIPKDTIEIERISIPQYSTLDPLPWIQLLQQYFIAAEGVPEVILGYGRDTTEASSKILYLAFQQNIEYNQLFLEQQIKAQLKLEVEFNFPENIAPEIATDIRKERDVNNLQTKIRS